MAQSLSGMMLYLSQPKFAANSVANELRIWIFGQIYVLKWWMVSQEQKQIAQNLKIEIEACPVNVAGHYLAFKRNQMQCLKAK